MLTPFFHRCAPDDVPHILRAMNWLKIHRGLCFALFSRIKGSNISS